MIIRVTDFGAEAIRVALTERLRWGVEPWMRVDNGKEDRERIQNIYNRVSETHAAVVRAIDRPIPRVVTLCGSTRFWKEFQKASLSETMEGRIVLSIGAASGSDDDHFQGLEKEEYDRIKSDLDQLHKRKIDISDEILVLNVGGYIGESTRSEIDYAKSLGLPIRYLEDPLRLAWKEADDDAQLSDGSSGTVSSGDEGV